MTLGGSAQVNAMVFMPPPDAEWEEMAELTGDDGFAPDAMRQHWIDLERSFYVPEGTPGHGFDGYLSVSAFHEWAFDLSC